MISLKKKIHIVFVVFCTIFSLNSIVAQQYIDMTDKLSNIKGHIVIDGNSIQSSSNSREQIIITGKDMVIQDRSSFVFHNIIVQLTGKIIVKGKIKPVLFDSYIFCKDAGGMIADNIIEMNDFADVVVSKVDFIKKIKGNPQIWIYDSSGKRVFKGAKDETKGLTLPISRYDVKVVGQTFNSKVLFY